MANSHILIIEDQQEIASLYQDALEYMNYETFVVYDGREAMSHLEEVDPALIILDMNLPHVSGHYLYKQICSAPHLAHVSVIIATANAVMADALQSELRAHDYILIKPINIEQLAELVNRLYPSA